MKKAYLTKEEIIKINEYNKQLRSLKGKDRDAWCRAMVEHKAGIPLKKVTKEEFSKMQERDKYHDYEFDYTVNSYGVDTYMKTGEGYKYRFVGR